MTHHYYDHRVHMCRHIYLFQFSGLDMLEDEPVVHLMSADNATQSQSYEYHTTSPDQLVIAMVMISFMI